MKTPSLLLVSWSALLAFAGAVVLSVEPSGAVPPPQPATDSTVTALRAQIASMQKRQKIERVGCAVFGGFTLWRVAR